MYQSYPFNDKDPIIDILRTLVQVEASLRNTSVPRMIKIIAEDSGVSPSAIYGWFNGPTISPRYCCVAAVVSALTLNTPVVIGQTRIVKARLIRKAA